MIRVTKITQALSMMLKTWLALASKVVRERKSKRISQKKKSTKLMTALWCRGVTLMGQVTIHSSKWNSKSKIYYLLY